MLRLHIPTLALTLVAALSFAGESRACGGCFAPTAETSTVEAHRMAFAVSPTRTVLWDQFSYTGNPRDFSWVLPVKPGAYVEASTDAFFEVLEAYTAAQISAPPLNCASSFSDSGCGCAGSADSASAASAGGPNRSVEVVHQGTVGPYETVTLRSTDPDALRTWLVQNEYVVPSNIDPVINAYVAEGYDFLALRLSPSQGIQQMTPVRVITPGGDYQLPLRMVAAGVGSFVGISLYVIGAGRYAMPDIAEQTLPLEELEWDWNTSSSNYAALYGQTLTKNGGNSYLTVFARAGAFHRDDIAPLSGLNLGSAYFAQAAQNEGITLACGGSTQLLDSAQPVVEACEQGDPTRCGTVSAGQLDSRRFECGGYTDLAAAMIGQVPRDVWITRMDMNLPATALNADCVVEPSLAGSEISNILTAKKHKNPPCEPPLFTPNGSWPSRVPGLFLFGGFLGLGLSRRFFSRRNGGVA